MPDLARGLYDVLVTAALEPLLGDLGESLEPRRSALRALLDSYGDTREGESPGTTAAPGTPNVSPADVALQGAERRPFGTKCAAGSSKNANALRT